MPVPSALDDRLALELEKIMVVCEAIAGDGDGVEDAGRLAEILRDRFTDRVRLLVDEVREPRLRAERRRV